MNIALLLILVPLISSSSHLQNCTREQYGEAVKQCHENYHKLDEWTVPTRRAYQNISVYCKRTEACFAKYQCKEIQDIASEYQNACDQLELRFAGVQDCMPKFFKAVYEGQGCTADYDWTIKNLTLKRQAYISGKQCFLDFTKTHCSKPANHFLNFNFDKFLQFLSVPKTEKECRAIHYQLEGAQCVPAIQDLKLKEKSLNMETFQINDTDILTVMESCKAAEECVKGTCTLGYSHDDMITGCKVFQLANTDFHQCIRQLTQHKTDLSQFECLKDHDFHDKDRYSTCHRYVQKPACIRKILEEKCGEKAVEDWEQKVEDVKKVFGCGDGLE